MNSVGMMRHLRRRRLSSGSRDIRLLIRGGRVVRGVIMVGGVGVIVWVASGRIGVLDVLMDSKSFLLLFLLLSILLFVLLVIIHTHISLLIISLRCSPFDRRRTNL